MWCLCSNPAHNGDPVDEFLPIKGDQVNFLDITNDGLKPGVDPNKKANEFWSGIELQIHQINENSHKTSRDELWSNFSITVSIPKKKNTQILITILYWFNDFIDYCRYGLFSKSTQHFSLYSSYVFCFVGRGRLVIHLIITHLWWSW